MFFEIALCKRYDRRPKECVKSVKINLKQRELVDFKDGVTYNPAFDSCAYKNPSKILINSTFFEGLFALKM